MKRSFLLILGIALVASSCEHKDYEEPILETPVFTISGYRNGEPFTLSAGDDGLIQTGSIERNKYGVMEWTSSFTSITCPTCDPEFSLTINDREGVDLSDCANAEIFSTDQIQFAQETSASDFQECELSMDGMDDTDEINFLIPGSTSLSATNFSFETEGVYQVTADYDVEVEGSSDENEVHIHQTIYAGAHQRVSAPFLYEVLEDEDEEQELRLSYPEFPGLRPTRWEVNGIIDEEESITRTFQTDVENRIEIFYVNDLTGIEGSYAIRFNRGFPIDEACDDDHHIMPAPSINIDWQAGEPNYERAFITYRWQGKTYVSTTPLNSSSALDMVGYENFAAGLQGNKALKLNTTFSVTLVEVGNESNMLELTDCKATFGFVSPH
jgi:hypothetical protein